MKKTILYCIIVLLALAVCFTAVSCKDKAEEIDMSYVLSFDECGGAQVPDFEGLICETMPVTTRDGYVFEGWYDNPSYSGRQVSFPYMSGGDATLYARWFTPEEGSPFLLYSPDATGKENTVVGYNGYAKNVYIPTTSGNIPVTAVADGAFGNCSTINNIYISSAIKSIGYAFYRCPSLINIFVSAENGTYCDVDGVLFDKSKKALLSCPSQRSSYVVPAGTESVGDYAFRQSVALSEVTLPASLVTMEKYFEGCNKLTTITVEAEGFFRSEDGVLYGEDALLRYPPQKQGDSFMVPSGIKSVSQYAFDGCSLKSILIASSTTDFGNVFSEHMESFSVAEGNEAYTSENGVLFDKEKKKLIQYPTNMAREDYVVPEGVEIIAGNAFYSVKKLKNIKLPASLTEIENNAFSDNLNVSVLEKVTFAPYSKLSSVGDYAFMNIKTLKEVRLTSYVPPSLGEGAFSTEIAALSVYVPTHVITVYNGTDWSGERRAIADGGDSEGFTVKFEVGNGSVVADERTPYISKEKTSARSGYVFGGWYEDEDYSGRRVTYPYVVRNDTTLYARWYSDEVGTPAVVYTVSADGKSFSVTGYNGNEREITIPPTHNGIEVTSIGPKAFYGKTFIEKVTLPETIEKIGEYAFSAGFNSSYMMLSTINLQDTALTSIEKYAFRNCAFMKTAVLPETLISVGNGAFESCKSLVSLVVPAMLTQIGDYCFSGCDGLTAITVDEENPSYLSDGGVLFSKDKSLLVKYPQGKPDAEYVIPSEITDIASEAFLSATLSTVTLPAGLNKMQPRAFYYCENLITLNTVNGLEYLDISVFRYSAVETVNVSATVTEIGGDLSYLTELTSYVVAVDNPVYSTVSGCLANKGGTVILRSPSALTSVSLPLSVTEIADSAFSKSKIKNIDLSHLSAIGEDAFASCENLTNVVIGGGTVGNRAFNGCSALSTVSFGATPPEFGTEVFSSDIYATVQGNNTAFEAALSRYSVTIISVTEVVDGLLFVRNGDEYTLTKILKADGNVVIPSSVGGISVTKIGYKSISPFTRRLTLPSSIEEVAGGAFNIAGELTTLVFDGAPIFNISTFSGCHTLRNIVFNDGLPTLSDHNGGFTPINDAVIDSVCSRLNVFTDETVTDTSWSRCSCYPLSALSDDFAADGDTAISYLGVDDSIVIPSNIGGAITKVGYGFLPVFVREVEAASGITALEQGCFAFTPYESEAEYVDSIALERLILPQGLQSVGSRFIRGTSVTEISFGSELSFVSPDAFVGCDTLLSVTAEGGTAYSSLNGVLFDGGITHLVYYPKARTEIEYVIPDSVVTLGSYSFYQSTLSKLTFGASVSTISSYAMCGMSALMALNLPSSLHEIGDYAMSGLDGIIMVKFPSALSVVAPTAFINNKNLVAYDADSAYYKSDDGVLFNPAKNLLYSFPQAKSAELFLFPITVEMIAPYAFYGVNCGIMNLPETVTQIGKYAFASSLITSATISGELSEIKEGTFADCTRLTDVVLPNSVVTIASRAFSGCSELANVSVPTSMRILDSYAFEDCIKLTRIVLPEEMTSLGDGCFANCSSLSEVVLPKNATSIGEAVLYGCSVAVLTMNTQKTVQELFGTYRNIPTLTTVTVHDGVVVLPEDFFSRITSIVTLTLPKTLTEISARACYMCTSLSNVIFSGAYGNQRLSKIGEYAFWGCNNLSRFESKMILPADVDETSFACPSENEMQVLPRLKIFVPEQHVVAYKEKWTYYQNNIFAI